MSETHTFVSADAGDKCFKFTVKSTFLKEKCGNPHEYSTYDLMVSHQMQQYLHNPIGPAIVRVADNLQLYWIDGQKLSDEEAERIKHNKDFSDRLMAEIDGT